MKLRFTLFLILLFLTLTIFAQETSEIQLMQHDVENILEMPVDQSMNIEIYSASKKAENLFNAPLSASVLTKDEIINSGATSIIEALRLVPGVMVREQTNGNYDVHFRGLENVPPNLTFLESVSTTLLVMIDNRPVYNYFSGGTLWETLPIDINDVDRIEIIRGPAAALYGPNAVTGVINIITSRLVKEGAYAHTNVQYGSLNTFIANTSVGYKFSDKFSLLTSINTQQRDRFAEDYYSMYLDDYYSLDSIQNYMEGSDIDFFNAFDFFPDPSLSLDKYGLNIFADYQPNSTTDIRISAGHQNSTAQKIYGENRSTSVGGANSETQYINVQANKGGLSAQLSMNRGDQYLGSIEFVSFQAYDALLEYTFDLGDLSVRPGVNYRIANYSEDVQENVGGNIFSGDAELSNYAGSMRFDYKPSDKFRAIAGVRLDRFNAPDRNYLSYQGSVLYQPSEKHLFRVVYGRASRSPFIIHLFSDLSFQVAQLDANTGIFTRVDGDQQARLLTNDMIEFGYRLKINKNARVELEGFRNYMRDFNSLVFNGMEDPVLNPETGGVELIIPYRYQNINGEALQYGATLSANLILDGVNIRPFVTVQKTRLLNYSPYLNTSDAVPNAANPDPQNFNQDVVTDIDHEGTPDFFGGLYLNTPLGQKFSFNINAFFYGESTSYHQLNVYVNNGRNGIFELDPRLLINLKLEYRPVKQLRIFASTRNQFGMAKSEFAGGDPIQRMVYGGLSFTL